jgi:hypothetical protein
MVALQVLADILDDTAKSKPQKERFFFFEFSSNKRPLIQILASLQKGRLPSLRGSQSPAYQFIFNQVICEILKKEQGQYFSLCSFSAVTEK